MKKKRTLAEYRQTKDRVYSNPIKKEPCQSSLMIDALKFIEKEHSHLLRDLDGQLLRDVALALIDYRAKK